MTLVVNNDMLSDEEILSKYGENLTDYIPFLIVTIITILPIYLIYRAYKKHKYNKAYKLQLLEEQNDLLREIVGKNKD